MWTVNLSFFMGVVVLFYAGSFGSSRMLNNSHWTIQTIRDEAMFVCFFMQCRKLIFILRILKCCNWMQGYFFELSNAVWIDNQCALGFVCVCRYNHSSICAAMQEPQHVTRRHGIQQHVFWIIQSCIAPKLRRRRTGEGWLPFSRQRVISGVFSISWSSCPQVSSPFYVCSEGVLAGHDF